MSQDIISPDEASFLAATQNETVRTFVGTLGEPAAYERPFHGISTIINYKKPLLLEEAFWSAILIQSYLINETEAKTDVWCYTVSGCAKDAVLNNKMSSEYSLLELTINHEKVIKQIDEIHLNLHKESFYIEGCNPENIPARHYSTFIPKETNFSRSKGDQPF